MSKGAKAVAFNSNSDIFLRKISANKCIFPPRVEISHSWYDKNGAPENLSALSFSHWLTVWQTNCAEKNSTLILSFIKVSTGFWAFTILSTVLWKKRKHMIWLGCVVWYGCVGYYFNLLFNSSYLVFFHSLSFSGPDNTNYAWLWRIVQTGYQDGQVYWQSYLVHVRCSSCTCHTIVVQLSISNKNVSIIMCSL